ncbi:uncharacterized protein BXIN_3065 [Babesia sp. Xinjiang]|uniref:uncharacterized protein n=1 Tax=Babesia sp. Xinjiang TaxID=462227 RepID=UPI000A2476EA|nr:uncharacterized protein BXIN_3065 [Babesia sp. Xinjiang]ORM39353.1 hypothetical protein BXIN_3065 [Babesia sp. Xinjiang]
MTKQDRLEKGGNPFYIDVDGEGFVQEVEEELNDCAINIKDSATNSKPVVEKSVTLDVSYATHVAPLTIIRRPLTQQESELHRSTVLELRRFIYNSIVSEDFCVSCDVVNTINGSTGVLSEISDVSSVESPDVVKEPIDAKSPSPSATTIDRGEGGSRKAQRLMGPPMPKPQPPVSESNTTKRKKDNELRLTGLRRKIALEETNITDPAQQKTVETVDARGNDAIRLEVNTKKLSNIVADIEHVQMCSSVPFPRLFRLARENLSAGLVSAGRRYFLASDSVKMQVQQKCHKTFLAHFYRRKRSVCFFCGLISCARTANSKQRCDAMRCQQCSFRHKWGRQRCNDRGEMVDYYHRTNDWRKRRVNPWLSVPKKIKACLKCFHCGKPGEANFLCRGLSCPQGAATIDYRCLEMLGKQNLDRLVRQKPHMFRHLRDRTFEFT